MTLQITLYLSFLMVSSHEQKSHQRGLIKIYLIFADFDGTLHRRTICSRAALRAEQKDLNLSESLCVLYNAINCSWSSCIVNN